MTTPGFLQQRCVEIPFPEFPSKNAAYSVLKNSTRHYYYYYYYY